MVEIVLSGGPCAGKTSALSYLSQKLSDRGLRVLVAPEAATQLILGGLSDLPQIRNDSPELYFEVQRQLLRLWRQSHLSYRAIAEAFEEPVVILYDRAEMDVLAYSGQQEFDRILESTSLTLSEVRDSYDAVIHLVSAAQGAEAHYTRENNPARLEDTIEAARESEARTLRAWTGHPHLRIVDNSTGFEEKLNRVLAEVLRLCEHLAPGSAALAPLEYERKYLLSGPPDLSSAPLDQAVAVEIEQTYLLTAEPDVSMRVRRRAQSGQATYYLTRKSPGVSGGKVEDERRITFAEYEELLQGADPDRHPIRKTRYCFPYQSFYFELDAIEQPQGTLWVLEIETPGPEIEVALPPGVDIDREVTGEEAFSNHQLSLNI